MIEISQQSKDYMHQVLSVYSAAELDTLPDRLDGRTILHLYPTHDTGEDGYVDALFFTVKIYSQGLKLVWTIEGRDEVELNVHTSRVRVFKDGSTMLVIDRPISIKVYQSLEVNAA